MDYSRRLSRPAAASAPVGLSIHFVQLFIIFITAVAKNEIRKTNFRQLRRYEILLNTVVWQSVLTRYNWLCQDITFCVIDIHEVMIHEQLAQQFCQHIYNFYEFVRVDEYIQLNCQID